MCGGAAAVLLSALCGAGCAADEPEEDVASSVESPLVEGQSAFAWDARATPGPDHEKMLASLLSRCASFVTALDATTVPVAFVDEGKRKEDPRKAVSRRIWESMENNLPALGYCARVPNPSRAAAKSAILRFGAKLAQRYEGGTNADPHVDDDDPGNPINERHVIPMLLAWDMIWPHMTIEQRATARRFSRALSDRTEAFMARLPASDHRRANNWMLDALAIRTYGAFLQRDDEAILAMKRRMNTFITRSYTAPDNWKPSSCANVRSIGPGAYGSYDLQQRDAFIYHGKSLSTVVQLAALRPGFVNDAASSSSLTALTLMKPYVTGAKVHREFLCTTVVWDKGNSMFGKPWDPNESRIGFRFARVVFPSTRPWLERFSGDDYSAWLKVFVSGKGDRVVHAATTASDAAETSSTTEDEEG